MVSSVLLSMGMFMLPPVMISTPIKILVFVLRGWLAPDLRIGGDLFHLLTGPKEQRLWTDLTYASSTWPGIFCGPLWWWPARPLLIGLLVGVVVSLFQALTSIQEQTMSLVPKMLAVMVTTLLLLAPALDLLRSYTLRIFQQIVEFGLA